MLFNRGSRVVMRQARMMSSSATEKEAKAQMQLWTKISFVMMIGVAGFAAVQYQAHANEHHHSDEEKPGFAYLKLRNKPFPWHYSGCDLLDFKCKERARQAEEALKGEK